MSLGTWITAYVVIMVFWMWVVRWGGAERIEGSFVTDLFHSLSSQLEAESIKAIGWLAIVAATVWFVVGLMVPAARFWW